MKVSILYIPSGPSPTKDEQDSLVQVLAIESALASLGHEVSSMELVPERPEEAISALRALGPDCVFNLVEEVDGRTELNYLAPLLLEAVGTAFTGCPAKALFLSCDKLLTKRILRAHGLPTPNWLSLEDLCLPMSVGEAPFLLKPVSQDASIGIHEDDLRLVRGKNEILALLKNPPSMVPGGWFAEQYVEGREFNLSLIETEGGVQVLPPAEIIFDAYPPGKPKVVGYRAKWDEGSFEYNNTPRSFEFSSGDSPLLERLKEIGFCCWKAFGLSGYARVDFRVDSEGEPFIFEINANPGIAPDSGFVAAAIFSGMSYEAVVEQILNSGIKKGGGSGA